MTDPVQAPTETVAPAPAAAPSITEINAVITCMQDLAVCVKQVMADGKIDLNDLVALEALAAKYKDFEAAAAGINELVPEAKSITLGEVEALVENVIGVVAVVKAA